MSDHHSDKEILLAVYEGMRAESLQHRQSIFNTFSLSIAGLLAIAAGIVATGHLAIKLKWIITIMVTILCVAVTYFIRSQRIESDKTMELMRKIEKQLKLSDVGAFINGVAVLPNNFADVQRRRLKMSDADWIHVVSLASLTIAIWFLAYFLPCIL